MLPNVCLIVSNNPLGRTQLRNIVDGLGLMVLEAAGVEQGLRCLAKNTVHAIIVLRSVSGEELLGILDVLPARKPGPRAPITERPAVIVYEPDGAPRTQFSHFADTTARAEDIHAEGVKLDLQRLDLIT